MIHSFRASRSTRVSGQPYYIAPDNRVGQEAFAVIREVMRGKGVVAFGRVVLAKRERVVMIELWDKGLVATTLRYPYEIRDAKEYFDEIPNIEIEPDMHKLAVQILRSKTTDFDPLQFVDRYEEPVVAMLNKKQPGLPVSREYAAPRPQYVVNLMDAVRRSIAQEQVTSVPVPKGRKRIDGQGETLLPIAGKAKKMATEGGDQTAEHPTEESRLTRRAVASQRKPTRRFEKSQGHKLASRTPLRHAMIEKLRTHPTAAPCVSKPEERF